jgi:hypothetical protein
VDLIGGAAYVRSIEIVTTKVLRNHEGEYRHIRSRIYKTEGSNRNEIVVVKPCLAAKEDILIRFYGVDITRTSVG